MLSSRPSARVFNCVSCISILEKQQQQAKGGVDMCAACSRAECSTCSGCNHNSPPHRPGSTVRNDEQEPRCHERGTAGTAIAATGAAVSIVYPVASRLQSCTHIGGARSSGAPVAVPGATVASAQPSKADVPASASTAAVAASAAKVAARPSDEYHRQASRQRRQQMAGANVRRREGGATAAPCLQDLGTWRHWQCGHPATAAGLLQCRLGMVSV